MSIDNLESVVSERMSILKSSEVQRFRLCDATLEIISEMTKSASEEPAGVLRNRIRIRSN
eukprot:5010237-Pyramimonas_sp.AAC.1